MIEVLSLAQSLGQKPYRLDNHELVKWVPTSKMGLRKDFTHDDWSAILYLNDNFFGGNTLFEGNLEFLHKEELSSCLMVAISYMVLTLC